LEASIEEAKMARSLEQILEDEKPDVVAVAWSKAEAMLLKIHPESSPTAHCNGSESGDKS